MDMSKESGINLLIISYADDSHALAVAAAMEMCGHNCVIWSEPKLAGERVASIELGEREIRWSVCGRNYGPSDFDVVWLRRIGNIALPEWMHADDRKFAAVDNAAFFGFFWSPLSASARWIHSPASRLNGESKIQQLQHAYGLGFKIPPTLISNDPDEIVQFIEACKASGQGTVFKTFGSMTWFEKDRVLENYTSEIVVGDLIDMDVVRAVPAIYQSHDVGKEYEVRSTFFGGREYSVRIDSQSTDAGAIDWRAIDNLHGVLSPTKLPAAIHDKCVALLDGMSLNMGCFDFIVDRAGDFVFVEVNQQGQFLWIEDYLPEMRALAGFCEFVIGLVPGQPQPGAIDFNSLVLQLICDSSRYKQLARQLAAFGTVDTKHLDKHLG
ncbi:hypothetical protein [Xanthomonas sp. MUS 060]|uniref:hypothetical protein n=1 Tax=Xanthomonas sp. MUS 060 TaxID=1588031 RepID=UPI0005F277B3|nr:hypothetical protein [Xanthomonas sp. MUS 060]